MTGIGTAATTASIRPTLGVSPPSPIAVTSSRRSAPARAATFASPTVVAITSSRTEEAAVRIIGGSRIGMTIRAS
ncbi:hypothetical protein WJ79_23065 [Burkholderia ubonensis]|nr:hypothetical protein WJ79_23065 [Burkholderia ubonensis]